MHISGTAHVPPATTAHRAARSGGQVGTAPAGEAAPPPTAPAEGSPPPATEAPGPKDHGLVRAAAHSHRSDVAALRQWINHPDQREALGQPALTSDHKGNGFSKAVAAYEAARADAPPQPVTEPLPPDPVVTDPVVADPVVTDPVTDPRVTEPALVDPLASDPATPVS